MKILENQMLTQRKPLLSASSYWVTLRPGRPSYLMFAKQMKNVPAVCRATMPAGRRSKGEAAKQRTNGSCYYACTRRFGQLADSLSP